MGIGLIILAKILLIYGSIARADLFLYWHRDYFEISLFLKVEYYEIVKGSPRCKTDFNFTSFNASIAAGVLLVSPSAWMRNEPSYKHGEILHNVITLLQKIFIFLGKFEKFRVYAFFTEFRLHRLFITIAAVVPINHFEVSRYLSLWNLTFTIQATRNFSQYQ